MTHYWAPAFSDLADALADVSPDELDVRGMARRANLDLSATPMPRTPGGAWEALIAAAQRQRQLLVMLIALSDRYRSYPAIIAAIRRSRAAVIDSLAVTNGDSASQALQEAIWREVGRDVDLAALATELRRIAEGTPDQAGEDDELTAAADAAEAGDGPAALSWTLRARSLTSKTAEKVGAPLLTELLKRLIL